MKEERKNVYLDMVAQMGMGIIIGVIFTLLLLFSGDCNAQERMYINSCGTLSPITVYDAPCRYCSSIVSCFHRHKYSDDYVSYSVRFIEVVGCTASGYPICRVYRNIPQYAYDYRHHDYYIYHVHPQSHYKQPIYHSHPKHKPAPKHNDIHAPQRKPSSTSVGPGRNIPSTRTAPAHTPQKTNSATRIQSPRSTPSTRK